MKLFDIAAVYASTFSPVNIGENCSPITMLMNRETFKFVRCFSRFNYPFLIGEIQVTLSHTPITSVIFIRYFHQFLVSNLLAYSCKVLHQSSFVTSHSELPLPDTSWRYSYVTFCEGKNEIYIQVRFTAFTSFRKRKLYVYSDIWHRFK